jgi:pterin-4a-carbinolamine dehydratase
MTHKMNDESIEGWLKSRNGWKRSGNYLAKNFDFPSFRDAIIFVNRVLASQTTSITIQTSTYATRP